MSIDHQNNLIIGTYAIGWLVDWGYWIAADTPALETGSFVWGAFAGIFWPVHLFFGIWQLIL